MKYLSVVALIFSACVAIAQSSTDDAFLEIAKVPFTEVKNQANSGTCWSFSGIGVLESEAISNGIGNLDLSEMFVVRNIYVDKAKNYIRRQGATQFSSGGLGHDVINAIDRYGIVPESAYSGLLLGQQYHDHAKLDQSLKTYLDSLLKMRPIPAEWLLTFESILDEHLGKVPSTFTFREKTYTPKSFAEEFLKFKKENYVYLTSFTHHPDHSHFVLEIPDNYGSELYFNVTLDELINVAKQTLKNGYSFIWDTDISNPNFRHKEGFALQLKEPKKHFGKYSVDLEEETYDARIRQERFESLITQDDHLLQMVGLMKDSAGKTFFLAKNSWGTSGAAKGMIKVSEAYFAINTITMVVPVAALDKDMRRKLKLD